ncbi:DUF5694 domain-containing protein [Novosphingobium sp. 1949]|uniref:DUF5694 domain-containing protein n=1 Tax=Novosphingobium organovorum TaxID=2930092 RepID=A0ABT0BED6_9SPHN|nr:DUF5694 domain-containing protein [Novosphingobium organovorum]MCJ2183338.1 DUF5694 domain-containing protein [Novosphingobium organovorum]
MSAAAGLLGLSTALAASAQDYRPPFDPSAHKGPTVGTPNRVLVLGMAHLSGLPEDVALGPALEPLLARLAAWKPEAIVTEDVSGLQCDALRRNPARYAETVRTYCWDPAEAGAALGLDVPAANAEAERTLAHWPAVVQAAERRRLVALFLAAGERGSALVQWLRLSPAERRAGDGLTAPLAAYLRAFAARRNETTQLSAVLAARLGLERIWSVDDHSADTPDPADPAELKAYGAAIEAAWDNPATRARQAQGARYEKALSAPGGLLAYIRALNDPAQGDVVFRSDFGAALAEPSPQRFGRQYLGYWETRNLRMVANIREILEYRPGTRLLAVVGASHKPYYEAYLNQMHDVRLVDAQKVLR